MEERLVTGDFQPEDSAVETTLRPHTLREYVGQQAVKDSLSIYIQAALTRHDVLDTWNMTRETLQTGVSGRVVLTLPGREDMAVLAVRMD